MRIGKLTYLFILMAVTATSISAQTASSSLNGVVTDPKGAAISNAELTLSNPQTGFNRSSKTNDQGAYQFLQVPPATYELAVNSSGFAIEKVSNVILMVNSPTTLDISMRLAGTQTV